MKLPTDIKVIRAHFVSQFPVPSGTPENIDDRARAWATQFAEQVVFEVPGQGWGMKRADPGRPIGKDTIAQQRKDGTLVCWDLFTGTGTGAPRLNDDPDSLDINDQVFVAVNGVNHLQGAPPVVVPPAPPVPTAPGGSYDAVVNALHSLANLLVQQEILLKQHEDASERRYRDLTNRNTQLLDIIATHVAPVYKGELKLPFVGTVNMTLVPVK